MKWFKKLSARAKVVLGVITSIFGFIFFVFVRGKLNAKSKLKHELDNVRRQTEMVNLEEDFEERERKLSSLRQKEKDLRKKIKEVEEREYKGEEVSVEEIDDFFKRRGLM
jgi:hypothetical protein